MANPLQTWHPPDQCCWKLWQSFSPGTTGPLGPAKKLPISGTSCSGGDALLAHGIHWSSTPESNRNSSGPWDLCTSEIFGYRRSVQDVPGFVGRLVQEIGDESPFRPERPLLKGHTECPNCHTGNAVANVEIQVLALLPMTLCLVAARPVEKKVCESCLNSPHVGSKIFVDPSEVFWGSARGCVALGVLVAFVEVARAAIGQSPRHR